MRLSAVTICVHESDALACTLSNRDQFDRWVIVTVPGDRDTVALCNRHGLECRVSSALQPNGDDALIGPGRDRAVQEASDALGDGWIATIAAYVLLPRLFRARIAVAALEPDVRYGVSFRPCTNRRMAQRLKWCEPWRADPAEPASADTLFQLASSGLRAGPVPNRKHQRLPMTALLLTDGALAWGAGIHDSEQLPDRDLRAETLRDHLAERGSGRRVLVAGCHPGMSIGTWAPACGEVLLSDDFGLRQDAALLDAWRAETAGLGNLVELDPASAQAVPARSVDVLYLPGEASAGRLIAGLPLWRRALKGDAMICGDLYGWPDWPGASEAIAQLFGPPDEVAPSGFWQRSFDPTLVPEPPRGDGSPEVVIVHPPGGALERVLVSLHAVRRQWDGPVTVECADPIDQALALACARHGALVRRPGEREDERASEPSSRRLVLQAGTLALRPVADLFGTKPSIRARIVAALQPLDPRPGRPMPAVLAIAGERPRAVTVARATALRRLSSNGSAALMWYGETDGDQQPEAGQLWSRLAGETWASLTPPVRVAPDSTVAVIIEPAGLAALEQNWPTWQFGPGTRVLAICAGVARSGIRWIAHEPHRAAELEPGEAADPRRLLDRLLREVETARLILLPTSARASPGAALFCSATDTDGAVLHSTVEVRRVNGALPLPWRTEPLLVALGSEHARRLCASSTVPDTAADPPATVASAEERLKRWLHGAIATDGAWDLWNAERWGWRLR